MTARTTTTETARRTYRYRLDLNAATAEWVRDTFETHRRLYNECLDWRIHAYETHHATVSAYDQNRYVSALRNGGHRFYGRCPVASLQTTIDRLDKAYAAFFRRIKTGGPAGFPRFKGRDRLESVTFVPAGTQPKCGTYWGGKGIRVTPAVDGARRGFVSFTVYEGGKRVGEHVGRVVWHRPLPTGTVIKTASVVNDGGHWYLALSCVVPAEPPSCGTGRVGIDVGLASFVTTSDGETLGTTTTLESRLAELRRRQRKLARCVRGSNRRARVRATVAALHRVVRNTRRHVHATVASRLVDANATIAVENLNVRGMMRNDRLARRIADAGWSAFRLRLESTAARRGATVIPVPPAATSIDCSGCGAAVPKALSTRTHECPSCGLVLDRDHNAARNILARAGNVAAGARPAKRNVAGHRMRVSRSTGESQQPATTTVATDGLQATADSPVPATGHGVTGSRLALQATADSPVPATCRDDGNREHELQATADSPVPATRAAWSRRRSPLQATADSPVPATIPRAGPPPCPLQATADSPVPATEVRTGAAVPATKRWRGVCRHSGTLDGMTAGTSPAVGGDNGGIGHDNGTGDGATG